jgi:hypothetical protein
LYQLTKPTKAFLVNGWLSLAEGEGSVERGATPGLRLQRSLNELRCQLILTFTNIF